MRARLLASTAALLLGLSTGALAQGPQDHQQHHPGGGGAAPAPSAPATPPGAAPPAPSQTPSPMMQGMPEQCRGMMQSMHSCMGMMHQMMQGRMHGTPAQPSATADFTKAYLDSADKMHAPMMDGLKASDPDEAFIRGMIPHHQGAIDMAKIVLQHGRDPQVKKWASDVIREQQREIGEMEEWLRKKAR